MVVAAGVAGSGVDPFAGTSGVGLVVWVMVDGSIGWTCGTSSVGTPAKNQTAAPIPPTTTVVIRLNSTRLPDFFFGGGGGASTFGTGAVKIGAMHAGLAHFTSLPAAVGGTYPS